MADEQVWRVKPALATPAWHGPACRLLALPWLRLRRGEWLFAGALVEAGFCAQGFVTRA